MLTLRPILPLFILAAATRLPAQDRLDFIKVLVFDSGARPSEVLKYPHYEIRAVHVGLMKDPDFLCDVCRQKLFPEIDQGPIYVVAHPKAGIAHICLECGDLVWRDQGKQLKFTDEVERKALAAIKKELQVHPTYEEVAHKIAEIAQDVHSHPAPFGK